MANEFIHKDVGSSLSEAEYDGVGAHIFNSQATGDIMYATSATQLSRLGITNDRILISSGSAPTWSNTIPAVTLGGALTLNGQAFAGAATFDTDLSFTGSVDSAAVADEVSLGGYEISAGHRALAISSEEVVVTEAIGASDRTLPVRINGVTYKIHLTAV